MPKIHPDLDLKQKGDQLVVATGLNAHLRLIAVDATEAVRQMTKEHDLSPSAVDLAGKLALSGLLLSCGLKDGVSVSINLDTKTEAGQISIITQSDLSFKASFSNPHPQSIYNDKRQFDTSLLIHDEAMFTVIKNLGVKEPYTGQVAVQNKDLVQSFCYYLAVSEQINSIVFISLSLNSQGVDKAAALMVQSMPGITEEELDYVEQRAMGGFPEISYLLNEGFTIAQVIDLFISDPDLLYLSVQKLRYYCDCSLSTMKNKLMLVGKKDLATLAKDPLGIALECHYCSKKYALSKKEIEELISSLE